MEEKKPKKKMGRPPIQLDWEQFEKLCQLQCSSSEIASFMNIGQEALLNKVKLKYNESFTSVYKKFSETGKCSLRRNQFVLSRKNASMAIWLGKIWLGQVDQTEVEAKVAENKIRQAIISTLSGEDSRCTGPSQGQVLEIKSPVLDQGQIRKPCEIQDELGTERTMGEQA